VPEALRVAVIGSGPAGIYACEALAKAGASVDIFDRLPAPYGLVRYGVAPDHLAVLLDLMAGTVASAPRASKSIGLSVEAGRTHWSVTIEYRDQR